MSKIEAQQEAVNRAISALSTVDLRPRCSKLGLPEPINNTVPVRMFGTDMVLNTTDFNLAQAGSGKPGKIGDLILLLHYLLCDLPIERTGELITYRDFTGGQFYYQPFLSRTVNPLVGRFRNDLDKLRENLNRFDWEPLGQGDVGARIQAFGPLDITLIYNAGDDEFPASAEVLFDGCVKRAFETEDAAVLASRICIGLL